MVKSEIRFQNVRRKFRIYILPSLSLTFMFSDALIRCEKLPPHFETANQAATEAGLAAAVGGGREDRCPGCELARAAAAAAASAQLLHSRHTGAGRWDGVSKALVSASEKSTNSEEDKKGGGGVAEDIDSSPPL